MNKVLTIEIARQVFRLEELAYENLTTYLEQIRKQLKGWEGSEDIYRDIELRIAELLFNFSAESRAINCEQVEEVIEQVGFIDSDVDSEDSAPRRSYRDTENKILAGVCAGLALRFQVPVIILRLLFVALTPLAGIGPILYIIFWLSLDSIDSRNAALAALGKPRTAKQLAIYDDSEKPKPVASFFSSLQRVIFLPISIIGALLAVIGNHLQRRKHNYFLTIKLLVSGFLLFLTSVAVVFSIIIARGQVFPWVINLILGISIAYLLVLAWAMYIRRLFLFHSGIVIARSLKLGAALPATALALAFVFMINSNIQEQRQLTERNFVISGNAIELKFEQQRDENGYHGHPRFVIKPKAVNDGQLTLTMDYGARGRTSENAGENLEGIEYAFSFDGRTLTLDDHFTLQDDYYFRGQSVTVTVNVPQSTNLNSPRSLHIRQISGNYHYVPRLSYGDPGATYMASGAFLHELDEDYINRLSDNEREVLEDKFCEEFFISESWACTQNVRRPVSNNRFFDLAFQNDSEIVDELRNYMTPQRSVLVSNLFELNALVDSLSVDFSIMSDFQMYLNHLIEVKSI